MINYNNSYLSEVTVIVAVLFVTLPKQCLGFAILCVFQVIYQYEMSVGWKCKRLQAANITHKSHSKPHG